VGGCGLQINAVDEKIERPKLLKRCRVMRCWASVEMDKKLCVAWLENPYISPVTGCAINPKTKSEQVRKLVRSVKGFGLGPVVTYEQLKQENEFLKSELESSQHTISKLLKRVRDLEEELAVAAAVSELCPPPIHFPKN